MISSFDEQTLVDLEFPTIKKWLDAYAVAQTVKERIQELKPGNDFQAVENELLKSNELLDIKKSGEAFPSLEYEELLQEIQLLSIKNAALPQESFYRIKIASDLCNRFVHFFDKREKDYPLLSQLFVEVDYTNEIIDKIDAIFDKAWKVVDNASPILAKIRIEIKDLRNQINKNFDRELRRLSRENVLGETLESFYNDRRVLTIIAAHKRMISGNIVGSSKTGSLVYIEPQVNVEQ